MDRDAHLEGDSVTNEETEFWLDQKKDQITRRENRFAAFMEELPEFRTALSGLGLSIKQKDEHHFIIFTISGAARKTVASYWPRPHHKFQFAGQKKVSVLSGWKHAVRKLEKKFPMKPKEKTP